jgi:mono/diheme cytochrome c family protein
MNRSLSRALLGIAVLTLGTTGCNSERYPAYSANVKYGIRTDPIVRIPKDLGEERYEPDRPGLMPIMKMEDFQKPDHPYYPNSAKIDDKVLRDPNKVPSHHRKKLEEELEAMFGTPAAPKIDLKAAGMDDKAVAEAEKELMIDSKTLAEGSTYYRVHCLHCHGVPGNGRGPTARWVNPHPRDFRRGYFKFQSVDRSRGESDKSPSRADLMRTLRQGLEGTAMPSFNLLPDHELEAIVSYVIHLSVRGQTEYKIIDKSFEFDPKAGELKLAIGPNGKEEDLKESVQFYAKSLIEDGFLASNKPAAAIKVAPYPYDESASDYMTVLKDSAKRGQQIFTGNLTDELKERFIAPQLAKLKTDEEKTNAKAALLARAQSELTAAKCATCHIDYGRQARYKYDEWGNLVRPNNFTLGVFRGGRRPVDIYRRVHSGIPGSEMPIFGKAPFEGNEQYLWDVVNFVTILPYPAMREKLGIKLD